MKAKAGWTRIAAALAATGVRHAGIEATGGYELGVVCSLCARGVTVDVLQPEQGHRKRRHEASFAAPTHDGTLDRKRRPMAE